MPFRGSGNIDTFEREVGRLVDIMEQSCRQSLKGWSMQESIAINVAHKVEGPRVSGLIAAEEVIDHQSWMNRFTHMLAAGERERWWAGIEDMDASGARQVMMDLIHHFTKCPLVGPQAGVEGWLPSAGADPSCEYNGRSRTA